MPYRCCDHCADDPAYHEENPPDSYDSSCRYGHRPCESGGDEWVPEPPSGRRAGW